MPTDIGNSPSPLMWLSSTAIVLFSGIGIAAFMGWLPTTYGSQSAAPAAVAVTGNTVSKTHMHLAAISQSKVTCADCGIIESVRIIDGASESSGIGQGGTAVGNAIEKNAGSARTYEVTVRFEDGSRSMLNEASPPAWQSGDHVRVIDGSIRPNS